MRKLRRVAEGSPRLPACVGLDLSLNGTGLAFILGGNLIFAHGWTNQVKRSKQYSNFLSLFRIKDAQDFAHRIHRIEVSTDWIFEVIDSLSQEYEVYVAIEGYALSKHSQRITDQFEQGGIVKRGLWQRGIPFRVYPPNVVKKAWTDHGKATKEMMMEAARDTFDADFFHLGDWGENLADATLIAALLHCELCVREGLTVPSVVHKVLTKGTKKKEAIVLQPFSNEVEVAEPSYGTIDY